MMKNKPSKQTLDKTVTAKVDEETEAEIERLARERDRSKSYIIRKMLEEQIESLRKGR